jgi:threonine dehydrogenase-like Zn-dependent dehydrogenase
LNPITVCSQQNFELAKSYGATAVFDYKQPSCIEDIRKYTKNSLKYVIDCVSEPETMEFCYKCLGRTGGKYSALEPYAEVLHTRSRTVVPDWVLGPSVLGEEINWPEPFTRQQNEELRNFGTDCNSSKAIGPGSAETASCQGSKWWLGRSARRPGATPEKAGLRTEASL